MCKIFIPWHWYWIETQLEEQHFNIYGLATIGWKYYNVMNESKNEIMTKGTYKYVKDLSDRKDGIRNYKTLCCDIWWSI